MIKVALKHFIYEKCINVIFDTIINNFSLSKRRFNVGDKFAEIKIYRNDDSNCIVLYHCTILSNIQGIVLVRYSRASVYGYTFDLGHTNPYATKLRVNIDDIKFYI